MDTKDYLSQQTAFQKRVSTSGPPLVRPPTSEKLNFVAMSYIFLYLHIQNPDPGKTQLLKIENLLVYTTLQINITVI
jgi:hypothetical protein